MKVTVEIRRPAWLTSRRAKRAPLVLLMTLFIAAPVLASDTFADVPNSNPHHNDINTIAVAGITRGCNPPANTNYCPDQAVRRDQMASFLQRGLGRGARGQAGVTFDNVTAPATLASTNLTVPGSGFVQANAAVTAVPFLDPGIGCSASGAYTFSIRVSDPVTGQASIFTSDSVASGGSVSASTTFLFDVDAAAPMARTFNVDAFMSLSACFDVFYDVNVVWVPFGSTGGSTLGVDQSPQRVPERSAP